MSFAHGPYSAHARTLFCACRTYFLATLKGTQLAV